MSPGQLAELNRIHSKMLEVALPVGGQHGWWYFISDLEAIMRGEQPMLDWTVDEFIEQCGRLVKNR